MTIGFHQPQNLVQGGPFVLPFPLHFTMNTRWGNQPGVTGALLTEPDQLASLGVPEGPCVPSEDLTALCPQPVHAFLLEVSFQWPGLARDTLYAHQSLTWVNLGQNRPGLIST